MSVREKLLAGTLLFCAWGGLVITGMVPVDAFAQALRDALIALGAFQAGKNVSP